jgi:CheY-like chemotaxis protein
MNSRLPTVLVVEDEFLIRMLVADELRSLGFAVIEAGSADEAFPILLSDAPVHVLFTDVRMPGSMDGVELARRARSARPAIRVIMTSGHGPDIPIAVRRALALFFCDLFKSRRRLEAEH